MDSTPRWQQRLRAPQVKTWRLLGPPVSWARDTERGVLLANPSGRFEVYAFVAAARPEKAFVGVLRTENARDTDGKPTNEVVLEAHVRVVDRVDRKGDSLPWQ